MSSGDVKFVLRIPAEIHSDVKAIAQTERRSVNAQILRMVEEALASHKARQAQQRADNSTTSKKPELNAYRASNTPRQLSIEDISGSAIDSLTPKQKELFYLLLEEELSYRELSQMLGINASSVRDRTSTILRKLGLESRLELLDKFKQSHNEIRAALNQEIHR